jgi:hypothetical protein
MSRRLPLSDAAILSLHPYFPRLDGSAAAPRPVLPVPCHFVTVASPSTQQKLARGRELKRILAQNTLLENQSNIDLLLGLLTYVAWSYDQFLNRSGTPCH